MLDPATALRFQQALSDVRAELDARPNVVALLFFGSVQRGEHKPSSDLDFCAVTATSEQWWEIRWVHGVEVQVQFGPVKMWRKRITKHNPALTSAFGTGELLFDKTGEVAELKLLAEQIFASGPRPASAGELDTYRFRLTNMVRDLEGLAENSVEARMLAGQVVFDALRAWCAFRNVWWTDKPAALLGMVRGGDAALAARVEGVYDSGSARDAILVADSVLEMMGGRIFDHVTTASPV